MKSMPFISLILLFGINSFAGNYELSHRAEDNNLAANFRTEPTLEMLFSLCDNTEKTSENYITQKEGQAILRIIHRDQLSSTDVINLKNTITLDTRYKSLAEDKKIDLDRFLADVSYVRSRLSELETFEKFHCRFALRNDPMEEVPENSVSKHPEQFKVLTQEQIADIKLNQGKRAVIGLCWSQAVRDPFNAWTEQARRNQYSKMGQSLNHRPEDYKISGSR